MKLEPCIRCGKPTTRRCPLCGNPVCEACGAMVHQCEPKTVVASSKRLVKPRKGSGRGR